MSIKLVNHPQHQITTYFCDCFDFRFRPNMNWIDFSNCSCLFVCVSGWIFRTTSDRSEPGSAERRHLRASRGLRVRHNDHSMLLLWGNFLNYQILNSSSCIKEHIKYLRWPSTMFLNLLGHAEPFEFQKHFGEPLTYKKKCSGEPLPWKISFNS